MVYKTHTLVGKDKQQRVLVKQELIALIVHVVGGSSPSQVGVLLFFCVFAHQMSRPITK